MVECIRSRYPFGGVKGQHLVKEVQRDIRYHAARREERKERKKGTNEREEEGRRSTSYIHHL